MHIQKIIFVLLIVFVLPQAAFSEETKQGVWTDYSGAPEADVTRDEEGSVLIHKDLTLKIEKDRKVVKVGSNVIRPQDRYEYVDGRLTKAEQHIENLEAEVKALHQKIEEMQKSNKQSSDEKSIVYA